VPFDRARTVDVGGICCSENGIIRRDEIERSRQNNIMSESSA
jgi:hypothetical protein